MSSLTLETLGNNVLPIGLALVVTSVALSVWYLSKQYRYWSDRGIPGPEPVFIFGNMLQRVTSVGPQLELDWMERYGKLYGFYTGLEHTLCVLEPALIKQIMVKDFDHFVNRRLLHAYHKVWNQNLFLLDDQRWKSVRTITSPTFTSGKLRLMRYLMNSCVDKLMAYLDDQTGGGNDSAIIDTKAVMSGFTIDVIASTSFATDTDVNRTSPNSSGFVKHATNLFNLHPFKVLSVMSLPHWFNQLLRIQYVFPPDSFRFFNDLVSQILSRRKESLASAALSSSSLVDRRADLVQMLLDARIDEKELASTSYDKLTASIEHETESSSEPSPTTNSTGKTSLNDNEIIAQCILFFVAGFETTASTISHFIYEMAMNPDVQERLCNEINQSLTDDDDDDDPNSEKYYEKVMNNIPYLDATIKETLRKYPPVARVNRRLGTNGYQLSGLELEKGQMIEVPVYALHHSPQYFPEPERFDPDRFMPERKHLLVPYSFMPFGVGPRNCVGMRFAFQEIKLLLARLVPRFRFSPAPDTPDQIQYRQTVFVLSSITFPVAVSRR